MFKGEHIIIEPVKSNNFEYIVKDTLDIIIGRIFIIEYSKKNKFCTYRAKFYKNIEECYEYIRDILKTFTEFIFKKKDVDKVNVFVLEDINSRPFIDLGFEIEGVLTNNSIINDIYKNELIFGVNIIDFQSMGVTNILKLKGNNIELKVLTQQDAEALFNYYNKNKEYLKDLEPVRDGEFYTLDYQRKNLIKGYKEYLNGTSINFGIYKEGKLIGKIQLSNIIMGVLKSAHVGYSIDEFEQGKGYMKEALNLVIEYAFKEMKLHRIEASILTDNFKSQNVLEFCGFKKVGLNKKYLFINGEWKDHITFCKINEE